MSEQAERAKWFRYDEDPPRKEVGWPFLTWDGTLIRAAEWDEGGYWRCACLCDCCRGFCSIEFTHWRPIPPEPNE